MAKKEIVKIIKLQIQAGKANPAPPVGPALGQAGINIKAFCDEFNAKTAKLEGPLPTEILVFRDKSFDIKLKLPPVSYLIKQKIGLKSGSSAPGLETAGKIELAKVKEIAEFKMKDLNCHSLESATSMVKGSAISMGLEIVD